MTPEQTKFLEALSERRATVGEAAGVAGVTQFIVRSWRDRDPEFDWAVRLTLLTNGAGRWLCGGDPVMLAVLAEEAAKPAGERLAWAQVQEAIAERGGRVARPAQRGVPGRPETPVQEDKVLALLELIGPGRKSLVAAARQVGLTMYMVNRVRRESPTLDFEIRRAVLLSSSRGRMLPGGDPKMRAELAIEKITPPHRRRTMDEIQADIASREAGGWREGPREGDLRMDSEAPPPAEPGSFDANF